MENLLMNNASKVLFVLLAGSFAFYSHFYAAAKAATRKFCGNARIFSVVREDVKELAECKMESALQALNSTFVICRSDFSDFLAFIQFKTGQLFTFPRQPV